MSDATTVRDQNIEIDAESFRAIADMAYRLSGLRLGADKSAMIKSRLRGRLRALNCKDFAAYCEILKGRDGEAERHHLISALTTNVSHFFREAHHFERLADIYEASRTTETAGLRIWSAGCAAGQEAISAAITILERDARAFEKGVRILATDIDTAAIARARAGLFGARSMNGLSEERKAAFFSSETAADGQPCFSVSSRVMRMIRFRPLNLLATWPMRKRFDIIFCRNVVIYFDGATQHALWPRLRGALAQDGVLFVGHSERIAEAEVLGLRCVAPTTYGMVHRHAAAPGPLQQRSKGEHRNGLA